MSDDENVPKKRKSVAAEDDQMEMELTATRQRSPPPPSEIFKLTDDCCYEMFEYLSLRDLHSFGQTCKAFHKVAGAHFKRNYSAKCFYIHKQGVYTVCPPKSISLPGFNQYVTKIGCYYDHSAQYLAQHTDEFSLVNALMCSDVTFKHSKITQKILPKVTSLHFIDYGTTNAKDLYENLSEMCPNLRSLCLILAEKGISYDRSWLHQIYPNLKQLKCNPLPSIDDLNIFFEQNTTVSHFAVDFVCIWKNRDSLLGSNINLDLLKVEKFNDRSHYELWNVLYEHGFNKPESMDLLTELYTRAFYNRLHLFMFGINRQLSDKLLTLPGLEHLELRNIYKIYSLPQLTQLKRLNLINPNIDPYEMELLANGLLNLERLSLTIKSLNSVLLPFIQKSKNLNKIRVSMIGQEKVLYLSMLNKEREKLNGAQNVTIYVEDDVYLATLWATKNGDTNLEFVEMRRISSFEWDEF